jgi:hypothetical protein
LSVIKAIKWVIQGGKRIGIIPTGTIAFKSALKLRKAGKNCKVFANNEDEALKLATKVEKTAHPEGKLIHHPKDAHKTSGNQPHVQTDGIQGHTFYNIISAGAATTYLGEDSYIGQGIDFINPLSIPKDIVDISEEVSGGDNSENDCECQN